MKKFCFILLLFLFVAVPGVFAQLAMELASNHLSYMRFEPIYVRLRIRNDSGRPLVFGQNPKLSAKIFFEIQDYNYKKMELYPPKAVKITNGKVINPGQIGDIVFRFSDIYSIRQNGIYRIHAYISHPALEEQYKSNNIRIAVGDGVVLGQSIEVGVPEKIGDGAPNSKTSQNKSRFFSLRTLTDGPAKYYYCRLEDQDIVYQVARLGRAIGTELPGKELDMAGTLHILVNIAPKIYKYQKFTISGEMPDAPAYYKEGKSAPRLVRNASGKVLIVGGEKAEPNVDFLVEENTFKPHGDEE